MTSLGGFVAVAQEFVAWCESTPGDGAEEARTARSLLARLYAAGLELALPEDAEDIDAEGADEAACDAVFKRTGALPFNYYSTALDSHDVGGDGTSVGDLADDVRDIYSDLTVGLELFSAGHRVEAEWSFAFWFQHHWGEHAVEALHALHTWIASHDD